MEFERSCRSEVARKQKYLAGGATSSVLFSKAVLRAGGSLTVEPVNLKNSEAVRYGKMMKRISSAGSGQHMQRRMGTGVRVRSSVTSITSKEKPLKCPLELIDLKGNTRKFELSWTQSRKSRVI